MNTKYNNIDDIAIEKYLEKLVGKVFKLLPMREENNQTLVQYHKSLMLELTGFSNIFLHNSADFISLLSCLESLNSIDELSAYKSKVFECINMIKKMI